MKVQRRFLSLLAPLLALVACGEARPPATAADSSGLRTIVVPLIAKSGSHLEGTATFVEGRIGCGVIRAGKSST
jgi:hypothetical protein